MITIDARGDQCPIPVVKTKKALKDAAAGEIVMTLVDNEIAVQNLMKMAKQLGLEARSEKQSKENYFAVEITAGGGDGTDREAESGREPDVCIPDSGKDMVAVISSDRMGTGNDELGEVLLRGFIYALSGLDELPKTVLFYNGGAKLTTEGSESIGDLKNMEARGVEILTCGTCLNYYGLADKLMVGGVTNMYAITEKMARAEKIVKPC